MQIRPHKLTFQEAWDTMTIFFVDEELEDEIDQQARDYLELANRFGLSGERQFEFADLMAFLREEPNGLDFILREAVVNLQRLATCLQPMKECIAPMCATMKNASLLILLTAEGG